MKTLQMTMLLTLNELSKLVGVQTDTLRSWVRKGLVIADENIGRGGPGNAMKFSVRTALGVAAIAGLGAVVRYVPVREGKQIMALNSKISDEELEDWLRRDAPLNCSQEEQFVANAGTYLGTDDPDQIKIRMAIAERRLRVVKFVQAKMGQ